MFLIAPAGQGLASCKGAGLRKNRERRFRGEVFAGGAEAFRSESSPNPSQSRIRRIDRNARDEIEGHRCRVFPDPTRNDTHCSTQGYVPLGKTVPQARKSRRAPSGSRNGIKQKSLLWDVSSAPSDP